MRPSFIPVIVGGLLLCVCSSCVRGAFQPVNVGREYGDKVPIMVSHIHEGRSAPHYPLQNILCFNYMCRKGVGRNRAMRKISFNDFKKRIAKNAKRGEYKNMYNTPRPRPDSTRKPVAVKPVEQPPVAPPVVETAPTAQITQAAPLKADSLITLNEVLFETNRADLREEHVRELETLATFLIKRPNVVVFISGHTDNIGAERHNVALSTRRAEVVSDYLIRQGVEAERITFEGFGSSQPVEPNDTARGRSRNRRVEILLSNKK